MKLGVLIVRPRCVAAMNRLIEGEEDGPGVTEEGRQHGELRSRRVGGVQSGESGAGLRSFTTAGAGSIDPGPAVEVGGFVGTNPAADSTDLGPLASQIL